MARRFLITKKDIPWHDIYPYTECSSYLLWYYPNDSQWFRPDHVLCSCRYQLWGPVFKTQCPTLGEHPWLLGSKYKLSNPAVALLACPFHNACVPNHLSITVSWPLNLWGATALKTTSVVPQLRMGVLPSYPTCTGVLTALIMCGSYVGNHNCYKLVSTM